MARAAFAYSGQDYSSSSSSTATMKMKSTKAYLGFLDSRCDWDQNLPIYGRAKQVQCSSPFDFQDYLDNSSKLSYNDAWGEVSESAGNLSLDYARYIVLASDLKDLNDYDNDKNLHGLVDGFELFKQKLNDGKLTESDLRGKIARVIFMAARVRALDNKTPGFSASTAFSKDEIHQIKDKTAVQKILKAGIKQIEEADIKSFSDAGHDYPDRDFYTEESRMLKESTSALFLSGTTVGETREYAPRWITPYHELDKILRGINADGGVGPGLIKNAFSEIFEHTSDDLKSKKDEALAFTMDNPYESFSGTYASVGKPKVCTQYRKIIQEMLKEDPKTGKSPIVEVFKAFGYSESEGRSLAKTFATSWSLKDPEALNIVNLCLNQALANSIRALGFDYFSRVIRAANGESGTGVTWNNPNGAQIMKDVLNKAKNPYALFSYPMGLASHEFLALEGKIDSYGKATDIVDAFCMRTDMLNLVYNINVGGTVDPSTGYFVPPEHQIVNDGMSGNPSIVPNALVEFVEKGKLTSKAKTTIIYNLPEGQKASLESNHVSLNDFVRWIYANESLISQTTGMSAYQILTSSYEGHKPLIGSDDSFLVKKIGTIEDGVFTALPGISSLDEADVAGHSDAIEFYELRDNSEAGVAEFNKALRDRKKGDSEVDSHWAVLFLKAQRGIQLHNNAFVQLEHKLSQSGVNVNYGSNSVTVNYTTNRYVSPLVDDKGAFIKDPQTGKIDFGHQKDVSRNSKIGHVGSLMDGYTGAEVEGFTNLPGADGQYQFQIPDQKLYRNNWDEHLISGSLDKQISNRIIYTPDDAATPVLSEVADFEWENGYTDLFYYVSKAGEKESESSNLYLGVTGSGGMFIPEYASNLISYDPFVKIEIDRKEKQAISLAKMPSADIYEPRNPQINSLITTSKSRLPTTVPSPNLNENGMLYLGADNSYGDYVIYLDSGQDDISVNGSVKMLGKTGQKDITRVPVIGATTYTCAFGFNEDENKFVMLPISEVGADGTDLYGVVPKDLFAKKTVFQDATGVISGYTLYFDKDMKYEVATVKPDDKGYKFFTSDSLSDLIETIGDNDSESDGLLRTLIQDFVVTSVTDEYGCSARNYQASKPGTPVYNHIVYNPYEYDNRDHGYFGVSQTVYRGYVGMQVSFGRVEQMLAQKGIHFDQTDMQNLIDSYDNASASKREGVDIIVPSVGGKRYRFKTADRYFNFTGSVYEDGDDRYFRLNNGKSFKLSESDVVSKGSDGNVHARVRKTVIDVYDADSGYQTFLEKVRNGSSSFYMINGGVDGKNNMVQLTQEFDEANTQYILKTNTGVPVFIFDYDALRLQDRYKIISPGSGPLWNGMMDNTDIEKAKQKLQPNKGDSGMLEDDETEQDMGSLHYLRPERVDEL
jgi:hypothetical protein